MKKIVLARGLPPLSIMLKLKDDVLKSFEKCANEDSLPFFQYSNFPGYQPLREEMAKRFGVDSKRVFVTNGSMDGLNHFLLFLKLKGKLENYICGKEVYDRPLVIAKSMGLNMKAVDLNEDGLDIPQLTENMNTMGGNGVVYSIPWYDNPSGILHSKENMDAVQRLAKENEWFVIRDGAYLDLAYFEKNETPDVPDNVLQTFSFSKTISAGLHTGGLIIPEEYADEFTNHLASWRLSPIMAPQMVAYELIVSGKLDEHITNVIDPDGRVRLTRFNELMDQYLPESKRRDIKGGHFWGGKIQGITVDNWDEFVRVADEEFDLKIPHHSGFMPLSPAEESAGYMRLPLFMEDAEIPDPLERVVRGIAGARDKVV